MNNPTECVAASSFDEAMKIATGQANKEAPHLTVPFYMPLAPSITLLDAFRFCRQDIRKAVNDGNAELLALAQGQMADGDELRPIELILIHGKLQDDDPNLHLVYNRTDNEIAVAVLMDGDGLRFREDRRLSQQEAVAFWMGGFLGWNEKIPGLYRLRYALIES